MSDRDLRTARPTFPRRTSSRRFDELDRVTAATLGLVLLILATLGAILVGALISGTPSGRWTAGHRVVAVKRPDRSGPNLVHRGRPHPAP